MNRNRLLSSLAALALLAGCSTTTGTPMPSNSPSRPAASPTSAPSASPSAMPSSWPSGRPPLQTAAPLPTSPSAQVSPERWQAITDHLAQLGVTGTPELVSAEAVTWQDSSLGCPSPGVSYTQALVDGLRVIVTVGDQQRYDFRFGAGTDLKLCPLKR